MDNLFNFISSTINGVSIYSKIYQDDTFNRIHKQFFSEGGENYSIQLIRNIYFKLTEEYFKDNIQNNIEYKNIFNSRKFDKVEACKICLGKIFNQSIDYLFEMYNISIELDKSSSITIIMEYADNINCLSKIKNVKELYVITICHMALLTYHYIGTNILGDFINEVKNMSFDDHINSFIKGTEKLNDIHDYKSEFSSEELIELYNNNIFDDDNDSDNDNDSNDDNGGNNCKRKRNNDTVNKKTKKRKTDTCNRKSTKNLPKKRQSTRNPKNPRK